MKALFVGYTDTHLEKEEHIPLNEGIARKVVDTAVELDCDIIHAGDWFTDRKRITLDENLLPLNGIFDYAHDKGKEIDGIAGNHDKTDQTRDESYLDIYRHHPGFNLWSKGTIIAKDWGYLCFLPYYLEKEGLYGIKLASLVKQLKKIRETGKPAILITHVAVNGVQNNDGSRVENLVGKDMFKEFDLVLIGHYHNRQEVKLKNGTRIVYFGSAFQRNFGEDVDKGYIVVWEDLSIEYRKFDSPRYYTEKFILPKDKKKLKIKTIQYKKKQEDKIRFKITGSREDLLGIDTEELKRFGIEVVKETTTMLKNIKIADKGEVFKFDGDSIKKSFVEFCDENKIEGEKREYGLMKLNEYV